MANQRQIRPWSFGGACHVLPYPSQLSGAPDPRLVIQPAHLPRVGGHYPLLFLGNVKTQVGPILPPHLCWTPDLSTSGDIQLTHLPPVLVPIPLPISRAPSRWEAAWTKYTASVWSLLPCFHLEGLASWLGQSEDWGGKWAGEQGRRGDRCAPSPYQCQPSTGHTDTCP